MAAKQSDEVYTKVPTMLIVASSCVPPPPLTRPSQYATGILTPLKGKAGNEHFSQSFFAEESLPVANFDLRHYIKLSLMKR